MDTMVRAAVMAAALVVGIVSGVLLGSTIIDTEAAPVADPAAVSAPAAPLESPLPAPEDGGRTPTPAPEPSTAEVRTPEMLTPPPATTMSAREPSPEELADLAAGVLGEEVPPTGSGRLRPIAGSSGAPDGEGAVRSIRFEVESDLVIDDELFATFVMTTLNDPRGWGADGSVRFERSDADDTDFRVVLATPGTVDDLCAPLPTNGRWSCATGGTAVLNGLRWAEGAEAFTSAGGDLTSYRNYLVNHEVGHLLGHGHVTCPAEGDVAPIMLQQSISTQGCLPNGWPFPDAG